MNKTIETLQKEIEYLTKKEEQAEEEYNMFYKNGLNDLMHNELFPNKYAYESLRKNTEKTLEFYTILEKEGIDINKEYYLTDDIYLYFYLNGKSLSATFNIKNKGWIYYNYINSWSGINEWLNDLINEEYTLLSGNSSYCHAWNTTSIKEIFDIVEDKENKIDINTRIEMIKNLIEFTKKDGKFEDVRKNVVEMIEFRLAKMKEMIDED